MGLNTQKLNIWTVENISDSLLQGLLHWKCYNFLFGRNSVKNSKDVYLNLKKKYCFVSQFHYLNCHIDCTKVHMYIKDSSKSSPMMAEGLKIGDCKS